MPPYTDKRDFWNTPFQKQELQFWNRLFQKFPHTLCELNEDEIAAWQFIVTQKFVTSPELMKQTGFDERKTQRVLKKLRDSKLLERLGKGPATRYKVLRP